MQSIVLSEEPKIVIQGEGSWLGMPMFLVRLCGCNLKCTWCDQPQSESYDFTPEQIFDAWLREDKPSRILLTGGEPLMHTKQIAELVRIFRGEVVAWHVETNGCFPKPFCINRMWIACSPKKQQGWRVIDGLQPDEYKYVIDADITAGDILNSWDTCNSLWLQPLHGDPSFPYEASIAKALDIQKKIPDARLGIQAHKVWGLA